MNRTLIAATGMLVVAGLAWRLRPRNFPSFCNRTVLITGGSRGLGIELARRWVAEGARVGIGARTQADVHRAVESLADCHGEVLGMPCDVTNPQDVKRFIRAAADRWGGIDVLVNNAGVIQVGPIECMTLADYRQAMETHFWGPLNTILAALPYLRRSPSPRITNIASIGGKISVPHLVPYSASKFALVGLSEGLRSELAASGILVTTVCPGLMRTGSPRNATFKGRHREEYAWFSIADSLPGLTIDSGRAAQQIIEATRRGDAQLTISIPAKIAVRGHAFFPGLSAAMLALTNSLLPRPGGIGTRAARGAESESRWSPSWLTALSEQAAARNLETNR